MAKMIVFLKLFSFFFFFTCFYDKVKINQKDMDTNEHISSNEDYINSRFFCHRFNIVLLEFLPCYAHLL